MITVPVPVMRGLLAQPRATVQVDRWNGRETGPDHGVKRQGPNGFPPTSIMTDLPDTGTHSHRTEFGEDWQLAAYAHNRSLGLWVPAQGRDDGGGCCYSRAYFFAAAARSTKVLPPFILWAS